MCADRTVSGDLAESVELRMDIRCGQPCSKPQHTDANWLPVVAVADVHVASLADADVGLTGLRDVPVASHRDLADVVDSVPDLPEQGSGLAREFGIMGQNRGDRMQARRDLLLAG